MAEADIHTELEIMATQAQWVREQEILTVEVQAEAEEQAEIISTEQVAEAVDQAVLDKMQSIQPFKMDVADQDTQAALDLVTDLQVEDMEQTTAGHHGLVQEDVVETVNMD